jgi:hypothetical protein
LSGAASVPSGTQTLCAGSVQSAEVTQGSSVLQLPAVAQSGAVPDVSVPHSASLAHLRHTSAAHTGAFGTSLQPPFASQSTQVAVAASH